MAKRTLLERLKSEAVLCAEGYLFELERRGYIQAGAFVPEVVLTHPEAVLALHREFIRAGSDVVEAFTYYGHREKLKVLDKEHLLEPLQKNALAIALQAAGEFPELDLLVAGNVCNTTAWDADDPVASTAEVRPMFDEQIAWAKDAGVDFVIAETFSDIGEAMVALESIKSADMVAVITMALHRDPGHYADGVPLVEGAKRLEQAGADVVGLNCARGPLTIREPLLKIREAVSCPVAALPVPYRTTADNPTFQSLRDPGCGCLPTEMPFPVALDPFTCNRYEMGDFARWCLENEIRYMGVCCGGAPHHVRSMAEALGRKPPGSAYSADMSKHYAFGDNAKLRKHNQGMRARA